MLQIKETNSIKYLILFLILKSSLCEDSVEVKLEQGVLLGKVEKTFYKHENYYTFKGVPYGKPPIGDLRFQPPSMHEGWNDNYEAFEEKPTCLQFSSRLRNGEPFGISGAEDCLYINIYSPDIQGSAPVVAFDFNDNFRTGFNYSKTYSPDFFVEEGVIVVTISNRLGIFGYLTTEDEVIPGNNGIRDFILGLQWIQNNIKHFGGDPSRVTLMGSTGSAGIAEILLYSEKAKGLFSGAMIHSGTSFETIYFYENPKLKAFELGKLVGIEANNSQELLQGLREADAEQLLTKEVEVIDDSDMKVLQRSTFPFVPVIEVENSDAVVTNLPEDGKIVNDVPILIGFNSREGLDLASHFLFQPALLSHRVQENILQFPIRTGFRFVREDPIYQRASKEILEFYFEDKSVHYANLLEYAVYAGDVLQMYALHKAVTKLSVELESPIYYYMFDFCGQFNENIQHMSKRMIFSLKHSGATVGDELCYLYVCGRIKKYYEQLLNLPSEQNEIKVLKKMVRLWTNFAKTRNPTPSNGDSVLKGFVWKPISKGSDEMSYLHITKKLRMETNPLGDRAKFWDNFITTYSQMAVDGVVKAESDKNENEESKRNEL